MIYRWTGEKNLLSPCVLQLNQGQLAQLISNLGSSQDDGHCKQLPDCIQGENGLVLTDLGRKQVCISRTVLVTCFRAVGRSDKDLNPPPPNHHHPQCLFCADHKRTAQVRHSVSRRPGAAAH